MHPIERLCSETQNQPLIRLTGTEAASVQGRREKVNTRVFKEPGREDEKMRAEP